MLRCQAQIIGDGADDVTIYDSHALQVQLHGSVKAWNSIIKRLGGHSTTSVHAVNTDSKTIGSEADQITVANVNAKTIGYRAKGSVVATNANANSIGYAAQGPVHVYENADEITVQDPRHWFTHETKMQSPVGEYST